MATWTYSSTNEDNLMKIKYDKLIEKQFNMDSVLFARVKKSSDFVGKQIERPVVQSIGGGVSAGTLPTANTNKISKATLTTKKLYAAVQIDRETMKAAKEGEGAFVNATQYPVKVVTKSFNRNLERQLIRNDIAGAGALAAGSASNSNVSGTGTSGDPYIVSLDQAGVYSQAHAECFEVGDLVNINTETADLEVTDVNVVSSTPGAIDIQISLVGSSTRLDAIGDSGTPAPFGASDSIFMQNSKDNELAGLEGILAATSGSYKGITVGRRWQSYIKDASSAALSTDLMNDVVVNVKRTSGESPTMILASFHQYIKLLNLLEDHKRYQLPAKGKFKSTISFAGVEYMSPDGMIPVVPSRFVSDEKMLFLNDKHIELCLRPGGFEWFQDDGTVFLRDASADSYSARYGGYCDFFVNPHFQGLLDNLQV